jgi:hypothetical protein
MADICLIPMTADILPDPIDDYDLPDPVDGGVHHVQAVQEQDPS